MSTQQKRQEYEDGDVKITPFEMGETTVIDVQEVGNSDAYIWFMAANDADVPMLEP